MGILGSLALLSVMGWGFGRVALSPLGDKFNQEGKTFLYARLSS